MSQRDSGWIQLYAETNQEALDLHIQAYRLAEELSLPVMVCMDGFILTHAYERVDVPTQEQVDAFLPPFEPRQVLDPARPGDDRRDGRPRGVLRGQVPDARQADAGARRDPRDRGRLRGGVRARVGRAAPAATAPTDAETIVVALGSVLGTIEDVVDELRDEGVKIGALGIKCFRPFPLDEVREALARREAGRSCSRRRSRSGPAASSARTCGWPSPGVQLARLHDVVAGLGGRPITKNRCGGCSPMRSRTGSSRSTFLDLDRELVERELERDAAGAVRARTQRTSCATSASSRARSH